MENKKKPEKKTTPNRLLDLRGGISPFALLKVSDTFRQMEEGEKLELLWSNSEPSSQIMKILPRNSWEMIKIKERKGRDSWFRIQLKKTSMEGEGR